MCVVLYALKEKKRAANQAHYTNGVCSKKSGKKIEIKRNINTHRMCRYGGQNRPVKINHAGHSRKKEKANIWRYARSDE